MHSFVLNLPQLIHVSETQDGYGTRLIPDGTIQGAHFVQTPDYVQVTGIGDLTKINVPKGDAGGELDPHGADGNGNPIGGLVFSSAFGQLAQLHEWTNFVSDSEFCFRGCKDGSKAPALCQHIYDVMGCEWNMPGDYSAGVFERCLGDTGEPMGVYGASTFHQGDPVTPPAHAAPATSQCTPTSTIGNGLAVSATTTSTSSGVSATTTSVGASSTSSSGSTSGTDSGASTGRITSSALSSVSWKGCSIGLASELSFLSRSDYFHSFSYEYRLVGYMLTSIFSQGTQTSGSTTKSSSSSGSTPTSSNAAGSRLDRATLGGFSVVVAGLVTLFGALAGGITLL